MKRSESSYRGPVSSLLALILAVWTLLVLIVPNVGLSITESMGIWGRLANVVLPAGLFALLLSLTRKVGKAVVLMIPLMVIAAFQLVLLYLYGRSVIAVDMFLNVVTTNPGEVGELLGNLTPIMIVVFVLYLPCIVAGIIGWCKGWLLHPRLMKEARVWSLVAFGAGVLLVGVAKVADHDYEVHKHLFPVNAFYNMGTAVNRTILTSGYHGTSAGFRFNAVSERPDSVAQTIVLVVGETSRAINWQLTGAPYDTNPSLMGRQGLVAFDRVLSQSNTTHKSVPMLLSCLDASTFGDSIYSSKSIITAFKEAGFATWFLSNQLRNRSFIDFFGQEADTCLFIRDFEQSSSLHSDFALLGYMQKALSAPQQRKLIVLHTYGSHFNYADRYPGSVRKFLPDSPTEAKPEYRQSLINAYNNSVLATSALLDSVITALSATPAMTAMLYTSDHGEDIFDDERNLFLHASPCPSYYQIHVPMVLWVSPAMDEAYPALLAGAGANAHRYVASSQAFFHTAMQLGGLTSPCFDASKSVAADSYTEPQRLYLTDHNEAVPLERSGLTRHDLLKLDSLGVRLQ